MFVGAVYKEKHLVWILVKSACCCCLFYGHTHAYDKQKLNKTRITCFSYFEITFFVHSPGTVHTWLFPCCSSPSALLFLFFFSLWFIQIRIFEFPFLSFCIRRLFILFYVYYFRMALNFRHKFYGKMDLFFFLPNRKCLADARFFSLAFVIFRIWWNVIIWMWEREQEKSLLYEYFVCARSIPSCCWFWLMYFKCSLSPSHHLNIDYILNREHGTLFCSIFSDPFYCVQCFFSLLPIFFHIIPAAQRQNENVFQNFSQFTNIYSYKCVIIVRLWEWEWKKKKKKKGRKKIHLNRESSLLFFR